ncbi:hypothetical protein B0H10DRAFT_2073396 [Mycena sp. CBHHK59/15]|nr:hypothetical protein B0H10DRAFT_2073396 [Mycena sp. CBHHK59/15]
MANDFLKFFFNFFSSLNVYGSHLDNCVFYYHCNERWKSSWPHMLSNVNPISDLRLCTQCGRDAPKTQLLLSHEEGKEFEDGY